MKVQRKSNNLLIFFCWLVYVCSYIGKLSYTANISTIENWFQLNHSEAGMVSTFFFFAYGVGQVLNGIFCKKYPLRYVICGALCVSGFTNCLVLFIEKNTFYLVKYLWLLNGLASSVLWPSLVRLISENLQKNILGKSIAIMGTSATVGTFLVYGISALFNAINIFNAIFLLASILLPIIAIIWLIIYPQFINSSCASSETKNENAMLEEGQKPNAFKGFILFFSCAALCAIVNNLVKDGLTTWTPGILDEIYGLEAWVSILLTMVLPLTGVLGALIPLWIYKRVGNFLSICGLLFMCSGALIGIVLSLFSTPLVWLTITIFAVISCLMAGINNVVTSMIPLYMKEEIGNSGKVAGILNGFCYLGSTLSSYGLGSIADIWGWNAVFIVFLFLCGILTLVCFLFSFFKKNKGKRINGNV